MPVVFLRISILELPKVYFKSTSGTSFLVSPSRTISFGAIPYPFPTDVTPTDSKDARSLIVTNCGKLTLGNNVGSEG